MRTLRPADEIHGFLIRGIDGDTVLVLCELGMGVHVERRVRLARIESWELRSEDKNRAKIAAAWITTEYARKSVHILPVGGGPDLHGRLVAECIIDGRNLSTLLIERGLAWLRK